MNIFRETSQVFCYTISHKNESDFFSNLIFLGLLQHRKAYLTISDTRIYATVHINY